MKFFRNIFSFFFKRTDKIIFDEMSKSIAETREELDNLSKIVEDQRAMIMYISTLQSELASECFTLADTLKQLSSPQKSAIALMSVAVDDDDFLN